MSEFHVRDAAPPSSSPRAKPIPKASEIPAPFFYAASDDGTDENLLILLHGLGDTHLPFSKLGKSLNLPQTAILALCAPEQVPFLYEDAYQWFPSFDALGETLAQPNPTPALRFLSKVTAHLTTACAWPASRIHFFGFAQGGSVAAEFGVEWWKTHNKALRERAGAEEEAAGQVPGAFGSIVTISGPLLSYPTLSRPCPTPLLVVHRSPPAETALPAGALGSFNKAYHPVSESKLAATPAGMPASRQEWEPIMRFWSLQLSKRQLEGLYQVMSGSNS